MKTFIPLSVSRTCFFLAVAMMDGVTSTQAKDRTWNGGAGGGNIGVWANNNNWAGVSYPTTNDNAFFGSVVGNSSTPNCTTDVNIGNLTFNSGAAAFTIGTTLAKTLTVTGTITQNASNPETVAVPLAGTAGLTKAGSGVLVITATNIYTGATTINAGKLLGKSGGSISNSAVTATATTATNGVQIATAGGQWTCSGLTYSAAGCLSFDFNNGIAPDTTTAPLQVNGDVAFTATPAVIILNDSILGTTASYPLMRYTGSASGTAPTAVTVSPALSGASASLSLDTDNRVLNLVVTAGSTPTKLAYASLPTAPQQGLAFSVTVQSQDAGSNPGNVSSDTMVTLSVGSGSGSLSGTVSGVITNGHNSVTISGAIYSAADTMTLTATPTAGMTGLTPITSGSLAFASEPTKLAYTSLPTVGTIGVPFQVTVQSQDAGGTPRGVTNNTTVTLSVGSGSGSLGGTTQGVITTGDNSVTISGVTYDTVETMTLTASATAGMSLSAATSGNIAFSPTAQTLHWGTSDAIWTDAHVWTNSSTEDPATYNNVAPDHVVFEDTHSGTGDRTITLNTTVSPGSVSMTANSKNFTISGSGHIAGGTGLSKGGAGTLTLGTANTFTGNTHIEAGTLTLNNGSALSKSTLDWAGTGGTLSFGSLTTAILGGLSGTNNLVLENASSAAVTLLMGYNNATTTYTGVFSGAGGLTKMGSGTLILSPLEKHTYTNNTTINGGAVQLWTDCLPHGAGAGNLALNNSSTLYMHSSTNYTYNGLSGNGTNRADTGYSVTVTVGDNNTSSTFNGAILNAAGSTLDLVKIGTGTFEMSGGATINGGTGHGIIVLDGTLVCAGPGGNPSSSGTDRIGDGATLEIRAFEIDGATLNLWLTNGSTLKASGGTGVPGQYHRSGGPSIDTAPGTIVTFTTAAAEDSLYMKGGAQKGAADSIINVTGPGQVKLGTGIANGDYAGKWTKSDGGTLMIRNVNSLGASGNHTMNLNGGTLELQFDAGTTPSAQANVIVGGDAAITPNTFTAGSPGVTHTLGTLKIGNHTLTVAAGDNATSGTMGLTFGGATTLTSNAIFTVNDGASADTVVVLGGIVSEGPGGPFGLTKNGTGQLTLNGANTYSGDTTIAAGTLALTASGTINTSANIIVGTAPASTAILDVTTAGITIGSSKTLKGHGTVNGVVTVNGTLSPGDSVGTLAFGGDLTIAGNLLIDLDKSLSPSPSNDAMTVVGTLTNAGAGTVTVTNLGPALAVGDSFQLFNKPVLNGEALTIVSVGSVVWINKLSVDGSIAVLSMAPPAVPATNLTIVAAGPTSFNLGGIGAANSAYNVYASTNVTTPMTNWWLLGTTNSDADGAIQFLDSQATNEQRFYRFGQ